MALVGGEAAGRKLFHGTCTGLRVTEQLIDLLNRYNREKIILEIIDLYDKNGKPAGTTVKNVVFLKLIICSIRERGRVQ
ncbi:MAG: hypothetical protein R2744_13545 [Bacteroidales bacterium]